MLKYTKTRTGDEQLSFGNDERPREFWEDGSSFAISSAIWRKGLNAETRAETGVAMSVARARMCGNDHLRVAPDRCMRKEELS